ncbi:MAG: Hint domain-containing protein [Pseudomonadota bacterium]
MADFLNGIFISEILADNAGGAAVDTDGDGNTNKADEFIEFGNVSGASISLDGYEVWSEKNGLLYQFGPGDTLDDGDSATVVGNYGGTPPAGFYNAGIAENGNFIPDGEGQKFDTIFLVDTATGDYIALSYGNPPRAPTQPGGFPGTTQVGSGESIDSNAPNGTAFARDGSGTLVETAPTPGTPDVACFAQGTLILTRRGEQPVEDLRPGDRLPTYDGGLRTLLGVCAVHLPARDLLAHPALRPLTVDGAMFGGDHGIRLSPAHCLLYGAPWAEALFASPQILLRARHLEAAGMARADIPRSGVTYHHLLFDEHVLVLANGMWAESYLNTGARDDRDVVDQARWNLCPGVSRAATRHRQAARRVLRGFEARVLLACDPVAKRVAQNTPAPVAPSRKRAASCT